MTVAAQNVVCFGDGVRILVISESLLCFQPCEQRTVLAVVAVFKIDKGHKLIESFFGALFDGVFVFVIIRLGDFQVATQLVGFAYVTTIVAVNCGCSAKRVT